MTTPDLYLVIGLVLALFSVPAILGALSERRAPRAAAIVLLVGGGLIVLALNQRSYSFEEIPGAFVRVLAHYWR